MQIFLCLTRYSVATSPLPVPPPLPTSLSSVSSPSPTPDGANMRNVVTECTGLPCLLEPSIMVHTAPPPFTLNPQPPFPPTTLLFLQPLPPAYSACSNELSVLTGHADDHHKSGILTSPSRPLSSSDKSTIHFAQRMTSSTTFVRMLGC